MRIIAQRGENTYLVLIKEDENKKDSDRNAIGSVVDVEDGEIIVYDPHLVFAIMSRGYWREPENIDESLKAKIFQQVNDISEKFNPHHVPAGTPEGGQFTTAEGGAGENVGKEEVGPYDVGFTRDEDLAELIKNHEGTFEEVGDRNINSTWRFTTEDGREFFVKQLNFEEDPQFEHLLQEEFEIELLVSELAKQMGTDSAILEMWDVSSDFLNQRQVATDWVEGDAFKDVDLFELSDAVNNLSDKEFTDVLVTEIALGNWDRHAGNVMLTNDGKILLIDNGRSFGFFDTTLSDKAAVFEAFENREVDLREMDLDTLNWFSEPGNVENLIRTAEIKGGNSLDATQLDWFRIRLTGLSKTAQIAENRGDMTSIEFFEFMDNSDFRNHTFDIEVILGGDRAQ